MASNTPTAILPIQYLRGLAALMVVWHHGVAQLPRLPDYFPLQFGTSGVDLFFVISGFIMVVTTVGKATTPMDFLARRLIRVVPLYWLLTLSLVAILLVAPNLFRSVVLTADGLIRSLLFVPHYSPSHPGMIWPILVPGWTLNYEMFFYAIFAGSLAFRHRFAVLGSTLAGMVVLGYWLGPFDNPLWRTYTHPVLLEFLAGAAIAHLWFAGMLRPPLAVGAGAILIGFALLVSGPSVLQQYVRMCAAVLIVFGCLNAQVMRMRNALLLALGDASYSIYLTHIFVLGACRWAWTSLNLEVSNFAMASAFMVLALLSCSIAGWLSYRWIERPMLRCMANAWGSKRVTTSVAIPKGL